MRKLIYIPATLILFTSLFSCKKLVEIDLPKNKLLSENIFTSDASATSAVTGIYSKMMTVFPAFGNGGITIFAGLSSDELSFTGTTTATLEFQNNALTSTNSNLSTPFWYRAYNAVYQANACLEGLAAASSISTATKEQLMGECKFIRALVYFYMNEMYGDVPLVTATDYEFNATMPKTASARIQEQILADLLDAQNLMKPAYPSTGVVRPNKWAVSALLARFYLYRKKYDLAEAAATAVIKSGRYNILKDLNTVFLANSNESIFQLMPVSTGYNTTEGNAFVPTTSAAARPTYILSTPLYSSFNLTDKRLANWVASKTISAIQYNYPYKYKVRSNFVSFSLTECYTVLRFAEQYLIRAEARANQGKITGIDGAAGDLDTIRLRAGLGVTAAVTQPAMLLAIEQERRLELFAEWGHRWFDLKRTGRADAVLQPIKTTNWQTEDQLYPIPKGEITANPALIQNPGYN